MKDNQRTLYGEVGFCYTDWGTAYSVSNSPKVPCGSQVSTGISSRSICNFNTDTVCNQYWESVPTLLKEPSEVLPTEGESVPTEYGTWKESAYTEDGLRSPWGYC